jgi:hypothetical protein
MSAELLVCLLSSTFIVEILLSLKVTAFYHCKLVKVPKTKISSTTPHLYRLSTYNMQKGQI